MRTWCQRFGKLLGAGFVQQLSYVIAAQNKPPHMVLLFMMGRAPETRGKLDSGPLHAQRSFLRDACVPASRLVHMHSGLQWHSFWCARLGASIQEWWNSHQFSVADACQQSSECI